VKKYIEQNNIENENIVSIVSGANVNFDRLRYISERADLGEHNEAIIAAVIPEQPGSFLKFCQMLDNHALLSLITVMHRISRHIFLLVWRSTTA